MYLIRSLEPRTDITMGSHGFTIELAPEWKEMCAVCGLTQEKVDYKIKNFGDEWLDACGYNAVSDGRRLYESRHSIRVDWGEWGLRHITVPGNACGLDIDLRTVFGLIDGSASLTPHNIDCWSQKQLLLIVFCSIAEDVVLFSRDNIGSLSS